MAVSASARRRAARRLPTGGLIAVAATLLVLAVVAALWLVPPWLDWNRYRGRLEELASAGLGRPVAVEGPISLILLPQPTLTAGQVVIADNGDGASATVREMRLQIGLRALLGGRVEVTDLVLDDAAMRLPWPPAAAQSSLQPPPGWLTRLHARIEGSTLQVGGMRVTGIDGEVSVDPESRALAASGLAELMGRRWHIGGRLGQAGGDGSAPLDISLDGQGAIRDTGGTLSGQIAADGALDGVVKARGPDLSLLLPAPAASWRASGRVSAGGGLLVASDLDVDIGGSPATGAVALRVLPAPRLDAALSASRLDLDAWLPALLHGGGRSLQAELPTGLDLSTEQATLAGGTLRRVRGGFELTTDGVIVRDAEATLPGAATLHLAGQVNGGQFRGDGRLDAGDLADTIRWLRPQAPGLVDTLPMDAWRGVGLTARLAAGSGVLSLQGIAGHVGNASIGGDAALRSGNHPALAATLTAAGLPLDAWLPRTLPADPAALAALLSGLPRRWSGFDLDLDLTATQPTWRGLGFDTLSLATRVQPEGWEVRRAEFKGRGLDASGQFRLSSAGSLSDGRFSATASSAAVLAQWWPWLPAELRGPVSLRATAAGDLAGLGVTVAADGADARLEANGRADLPGRRWSGAVSARHPGAPRLLELLGVPGAGAWLGDGSLSLIAQADAAPGKIALRDAELVAGALRATATLSLDLGAVPTLAGTINAETLPLPLPVGASSEPMPFGLLNGWRAQLAINAAQVQFGLIPALGPVTATAALADGVLRLDPLTAGLADGHLAGSLTIGSGDPATPPHLAIHTTTAGVLLGALPSYAVPGVSAGRLDGAATLQADGYSPAALLATITGDARFTVQDGVLSGVDLAAAAAALRQPGPTVLRSQVAAALGGGATPFNHLDLAAVVDHGGVTLRSAKLDAAAGTLAAAGSYDVPAGAEDLTLTLHPNLMGQEQGPALELRLMGPAAAPQRALGLSDLTRFLGAQQASAPP